MRVAVVGAGASGLVTLKYLRDAAPEADLVCFERSRSVRGAWGDEGPEFVSTSTKYATQFSCFRRWAAEVSGGEGGDEFFRGGEFGDYLDDFADHFELRRFIRFNATVRRFECRDERWILTVDTGDEEIVERFDAVFVCTGLAHRTAPFSTPAIPIAEDPRAVRGACVVVVGGGESATDIAAYLAEPEHDNTVYLSLRSGVRVSPRYHPIRGVPSDFLRNRLLLSFDRDIRNRIGERFVAFRIRWRRFLGMIFPRRGAAAHRDGAAAERAVRRNWDLKLTEHAKDRLFNVFHNKSDEFLDAVAAGRLRIIGPSIDERWTHYFDFDRLRTVPVEPEVVVWSGGYRSGLKELTDGAILLKDFYHGCVYTGTRNLFLIGFARPIIGNIPSIAEMQARYAVAVLTGDVRLPAELCEVQTRRWNELRRAYPAIDVDNVYPVEQFPYCDTLAREMGIMPSRERVGARVWSKLMLIPASTTHYVDEYFDENDIAHQTVYNPAVITGILHLIRVMVAVRRRVRRRRTTPR
ncbi:MAG: FAD/NAD(P)-binding protein [Spirochaetales bacterium]|nr:FAD/NAD(P)-binding protein [Spirochaetales bacterium]